MTFKLYILSTNGWTNSINIQSLEDRNGYLTSNIYRAYVVEQDNHGRQFQHGPYDKGDSNVLDSLIKQYPIPFKRITNPAG